MTKVDIQFYNIPHYELWFKINLLHKFGFILNSLISIELFQCVIHIVD